MQGHCHEYESVQYVTGALAEFLMGLIVTSLNKMKIGTKCPLLETGGLILAATGNHHGRLLGTTEQALSLGVQCLLEERT